jgi:hypothetical protein
MHKHKKNTNKYALRMRENRRKKPPQQICMRTAVHMVIHLTPEKKMKAAPLHVTASKQKRNQIRQQ